MKSRRWMMIAAALVIACAALGAAFWYFDVYREPVALLEGIEFGMSPEEAQAVLGVPSDTQKVTGMNGITYTTLVYEDVQVSGFRAQVHLKFRPFRLGNVLETCTVTFEEKIHDYNLAVGLYQWVMPLQWHDELDVLLSDQLCGENGFIRTEKAESSIVYEKSRGPVGTTYSLEMTDDGSSVQLVAECDEFYR